MDNIMLTVGNVIIDEVNNKKYVVVALKLNTQKNCSIV